MSLPGIPLQRIASTPTMDQSHMTEKILHLTLEIICLLTGETFTAVTSGDLVAIMAPQHHFVIPKRTNKEIILEVTKKIIELLTGEVPIRCQDVAVYLSMEERDYLEEHRELYTAAMMEEEQPLVLLDDPSEDDPPERSPCPLYAQTSIVESRESSPEYQSAAEVTMMMNVKVEECCADIIDVDSSDEVLVTPDLHHNMAGGSPDPSDLKDSSLDKLQTLTHKFRDGGEEPISCSHCSKAFTSKYALLSHLRVHSGERPYLCCECGKRFTQRRNLIRHEQIHSGGRGFPCATCRRTFTRKLYLDKHLKNHPACRNDVTTALDAALSPDHSVDHDDNTQAAPGMSPVTAIIYPALTETLTDLSNLVHSLPNDSITVTPDISPALHPEEISDDLPHPEILLPERAHLDEDQVDETFSCSECGECFKSKGALHGHWKVHMEERPFPCFECGKCFARKDNLIQHQIIHSGEKPFACNLCNKSFARKSNLAEHRKTHIVPEQTVKPSCMGHATSSSEHVAEVEITLDYPEEDPAVPSEETSGDPLANPEQTFTDKSHGGQDREGDSHKCSQCAKCFSSKYALLSHQRVHTEERPFTCFECGKRFTRKDNLKQHLTLHSRDRPLSRPATQKPFSWKSDLAKHRKAHKVHGHSDKDTPEEHDASSPDHDAEVEITLDFPEEKPATPDTHPEHDNSDISADLSNPEESSPKNTHTNTHKAKHSCSECSKSFSSKYALLSHRRIHSGERPYACMECGKRFTRKDNLVRHRIIHSKGYKPGKHFSRKSNFVEDLINHTDQDRKKNSEGDQTLPPDVAEVIIMFDYPEENPVVESSNPSPNIAETSAEPSNPEEPSLDTSHTDTQSAGGKQIDKVSCSVCGKCFSSRYALHSHGRIHTEGSYPCSECGKRFTRKYNLKQHLILHAKKKLFQRATSRRSYSEKLHLDGYQATHPVDGHHQEKTSREHVTSLSDGEEVVEITLDFPEEIPIYAGQHSADRSAEEPSPDQLHFNSQSAEDQEEGAFSCVECGIRFISLNALQSHQRVHSDACPTLRSESHTAQEASETPPSYQIERTKLMENPTDRNYDGKDEPYVMAGQSVMEETRTLVKMEEEEHSIDIRSAHGHDVKRTPEGGASVSLTCKAEHSARFSWRKLSCQTSIQDLPAWLDHQIHLILRNLLLDHRK